MIDIEGIIFKTSLVSDGNMSFLFGESGEVLSNRKNFLHSITLNYDECVAMACDHGENIVLADHNSPAGAVSLEQMPNAEVLLTNTPHLPLMLLTADCIPAIFYDKDHNAIALAHLNRKTIAHHLAKKVVQKMKEVFNTDASKLYVWFEPHIHASSYSFSTPLLEPLLPELTEYVYEKNGRIHINFSQAHADQLISVGVSPENILISEVDVGISSDYFSHTSSKQDPARTQGRHATVVSLR